MADDAVFQDAIESLRAGNKAKARDLLTTLLKTEQNNVNYWIWLSAAMDSTKERVYCLQTAHKLDPENATAKRGLILLGALPADENVRPFPVNRPRAWEEKLLLAHEKPKPKGWAAVKQSPVFRLGIVILTLGGLVGAAVFGFIIPRASQARVIVPTATGPTPTFTASPTAIGAKPKATQPAGTLDALAAQFGNVDYTPTALYVQYQGSPETFDYLIQFENAYAANDWDKVVTALENIIQLEPTALYAYYYLGEAYRFKKDPFKAMQAYEQGITQNADYAPFYLGMARARLMVDPNSNVLPLLDNAVELDPNFGETYLERAKVKIRDNDLNGAINDLGTANKLLPGSPLVLHYVAVARYREGNYEVALVAAEQARQLDVKLVANYLLLGQIHYALGNYDKAIQALQIYLKIETEDVTATMLLGKIYFDTGDYEQTIVTMNTVIALERTRQEAYLYRFLSNVELGNGSAADEDIDAIIEFYPESFDANVGILRAHFINERYGSAEQSIEKTEVLAETDEQKALIYYWAGMVYEKRQNPKKAAEYWSLLLELPEDAMTEDMRAEAEEHLLAIYTPTPTRSVTATVTKTPTRTPTPTP
jgi:tetratricopeptide (TPR) repeat protein